MGFLQKNFKIHDSCGVNNLHGMPGLFGGLLSVLMAGIASPHSYDRFSDGVETEKKSLTEIFPALALGGSASGQAISQLLAILVTLAFALVGGFLTGLVLLIVAKLERMEGDDFYNDDWNINDTKSKEELTAEDLKCLFLKFEELRRESGLAESNIVGKKGD